MDLQTLYRNMSVSHLSIDEVEHELLIRNILYGLDEHESKKRRKLKDRMKIERDTNVFVVSPSWRDVKEEIRIIGANLTVIGGLLNNPKADAHQRQKLCTRLVHYRVRSFLLARATGSEKHLVDIHNLGKQASKLFQFHFPEVEKQEKKVEKPAVSEKDIDKALEQVRSEIEVLNETATGNQLEEGDLQDEASGGVENKTPKAGKVDLEASMKKNEEMLEILSEYEEGKQQNVDEIIEHFKEFVLKTKEQQKLMREKEKAMEEKRMKEAEENIQRKKELENLLLALNNQLKANQEKIEKEKENKEQLKPKNKDNEPNPVKKEESELESEVESEGTGDDKKKEKSVSESSSSESVSDKSTKIKSEKVKKRKGKGEKLKSSSRKKRDKKCRQRKVSFSSISSPSSQSTATSSSEISSPFSDSESSSSSSGYVRRNRRKHGKERKTRSSLKRIPISEWRLKYDGKDQGRRLSEFLKEVKMRCKSEDISERELFRGAIHLFTGRAKDWYMEGFENRDFRSWSELKRELKREFLPPDLDFQIEIQATGRRQARGEKFVDYMHDMQKLFQSMTKPISEHRRFEIIWRNMRFDYKNALTGAGIKSLSKLKKYGRIIDENNWNLFQKPTEGTNRSRTQHVNEISATNSYKSKPSSGRSENTKSFFKSKPTGKDVSERKNRNDDQKGGREGKKGEEPMEGSTKGTLKALAKKYERPPIGTCYNCRKSGHHYADCPDKRRKFCRLCGFSDVITPECPFCQKNEQNSA